MQDFQQSMQMLTISFMPLMIAMIFHEYAHGFVAKRWGDKTAEEQGRLTLNPLPHVDPLGTVILPVGMMLMGTGFVFGWAKPVPIDPRRFKKYRPGLFWVSFAGPAMNILLALFSALIFAAILRFVPADFSLKEPLVGMAHYSVGINLVLAAFNLLPIPPLDGSKIIQSRLSPQATIKYESMARFSFVIIMGLIFTGAIRVLLYPAQVVGDWMLLGAANLFGLGGSLGL
ncbi:MAG: site-2 protease family protein [Bdellovibrionales bacterium]|nr:site-2 protease family protein [Bdellovibrionales bacterium]